MHHFGGCAFFRGFTGSGRDTEAYGYLDSVARGPEIVGFGLRYREIR